MNKVCVLLAAYNGDKWLSEQLDSILGQENVNLDIFISLDRSNDNSLNIIEEYSNTNRNIHILPYGQQYGSAGANFFRLMLDVDISAYDYVSFADQDDVWLKNKLSNSIALISENQADAYSGNVMAFWANGKKRLVNKSQPQKKYDYLFESAGPGCSFVLSRKLVKDMQSLLQKKVTDTKSLWLHDWFCYSFARSRGYKWVIGEKPLMMYRQHELNEVGANSGISALYIRAKVVLFGDAIDRVLTQASYIEQSELPIELLKKNSVSSLFKLSLLAFKCRRKNSECCFFYIAILIKMFRRVLLKK